MSREEAKSEMQKFKGEALFRTLEGRRKLLADIKSNKSRWVLLTFYFIPMVAVGGLVAVNLHFKLNIPLAWIPILDLFMFFFFCQSMISSFLYGNTIRRIDALIELIGEENLLKKS